MVGKEARKAWVMPELIVLARGKPEEAVLTVCKLNQTKGGTVNGPYYSKAKCYSSQFTCDASQCQGTLVS